MTIWKNNVSVLIHINYTPWQLLVKKLITHEFWQVKRPSNITNFILLTWRPFWFVGVYNKKYPVSAKKYLQNKKVSMIWLPVQVQTLLSFYTKCVTSHVVGSCSITMGDIVSLCQCSTKIKRVKVLDFVSRFMNHVGKSLTYFRGFVYSGHWNISVKRGATWTC